MTTRPAHDSDDAEFDFNSPIPDELAENIAAFGDHLMRLKLAASTHLAASPAIALLGLNDTEITDAVLANPELPRRARAWADKNVKQRSGFGLYRRGRGQAVKNV
jgi:hypothetical protein